MWDLIGWTLKFASHYCTTCCRWWIHGEICCAQCCRSRTRFYCCNIARNIARNKFWGGYTMQFSHCAQYCTVYPDLNNLTVCLCADSIWHRGESELLNCLWSAVWTAKCIDYLITLYIVSSILSHLISFHFISFYFILFYLRLPLAWSREKQLTLYGHPADGND